MCFVDCLEMKVLAGTYPFTEPDCDLVLGPPRGSGRCSGERERGECRSIPGDWQPGVLRTRERCSSRMAWGSSSQEPGGSKGREWDALLPDTSDSSRSSSYKRTQRMQFYKEILANSHLSKLFEETELNSYYEKCLVHVNVCFSEFFDRGSNV